MIKLTSVLKKYVFINVVVFVINNQQTQLEIHPKVCRNTGTETGRI